MLIEAAKFQTRCWLASVITATVLELAPDPRKLRALSAVALANEVWRSG